MRPILATVRYLPCSITGFFLNVRPQILSSASTPAGAYTRPFILPPARAAHCRHSRLACTRPVLDHDRRARDRTRAALVCRAGLLGPVLAVAISGHDPLRLWRRLYLVSRAGSFLEERFPRCRAGQEARVTHSFAPSACGILYVSMVAGPGHQALAGSIFNMSTRELTSTVLSLSGFVRVPDSESPLRSVQKSEPAWAWPSARSSRIVLPNGKRNASAYTMIRMRCVAFPNSSALIVFRFGA